MLLKNEKYAWTFPGKALARIIIIILLPLSACEFIPEDPTLTRIDPPGNPPPIQISLNNGYDTVRIDWITTFSYNVYGKNRILSVSINFEGTDTDTQLRIIPAGDPFKIQICEHDTDLILFCGDNIRYESIWS